MKKFLLKICVGILALALGIVAVKYISPKPAQTNIQSNAIPSNATVNFSEQREENETFILGNKSVQIANINGSVEIEYADVTEAEVKVIRLANKEEDFGYRRLSLDESKRKIKVRIRKSPSLWALLGTIPEERQRVTMKLPFGTRVSTKCINGYVEERETQNGQLEVKRTNSQCSL